MVRYSFGEEKEETYGFNVSGLHGTPHPGSKGNNFVYIKDVSNKMVIKLDNEEWELLIRASGGRGLFSTKTTNRDKILGLQYFNCRKKEDHKSQLMEHVLTTISVSYRLEDNKIILGDKSVQTLLSELENFIDKYTNYFL